MTLRLAVLLCLPLTARAADARKLTPAEEASQDFKQGMAAKMRGDYSGAVEGFSKALALNESMPGAHLARGLTYLDSMMAASRYEFRKVAEEDLLLAVAQAPKNPLALCGLALLRALDGNPAGEADLSKAAALRDTLPAYGYAAGARFRLNDRRFKEAVMAYKKAFEASPQDSPLREWIRREMDVVRERIRYKHEAPEKAPAAAEPAFEPEPFLADLADGDPKVRAAAARALGRADLDAAVEPLYALLKDPDLAVRASALQSLGAIGNPRAVRVVVPFLAEKSRYMRALAARTLGKIGSERGRKPLEELLRKEKEALVSAEARRSLKEIDDAAYTLKMDMDLLMEEMSAK